MVVLSVGLTASSFVPLNTMTATVEPPSVSASGRAAGVIHSTNTTTVVVAFRSAQTDVAGAATAATKQAAWDIAQATAVSARALRKDAAAVTFDTSLTREQATKISKAAAKNAAIKYAEPSVTFYPTDAGGSGYYWNIDQINASAAWASAPSKGKGVVVGVIDTGIADNALLPKALLVNTIGGVTSGTTVSGTTWPGRPVTISYKSKDGDKSATSAPSDARGLWSIDLDPKPIDGTTLVASVANGSAPATVSEPIKVDSTVTEFSVAPSNGSSFHGTVEPGSKVTLRTTDGWSAAADVDGGTWKLTSLDHTFAHGDTVTVTATDKRGNKEPITITIDQISELSVDNPSKGTITGTAEKGSTISVTRDGEELCSATANDDQAFSFSCILDPIPDHGETVTVTATDPATNVAHASVIIDTKAPVVAVDPTNGTTLKGSVSDEGPVGSITVTATYPDGTTAETVVTSGSNWSITDLPTLEDGDTITITATDAAGNVSEPKPVTVDQVPPDAPQVNATNGETVNGTAEPGATITINYKEIVGWSGRRANTTPHTATGEVAADGTWSLTLNPVAGDNTTISVTATDPAGNTSHPTTRQVHAAAPSAPTVAVSDGTVVNIDGVEEGATVSIVDSANAPVPGDWDAIRCDGACAFTPTTALTESDTVFVFVTDSDGTPSDKVAVTIDTTIPDAPVISDATTASVAGTGEVNATVTISYHGADDADHTVATLVDANGAWATALDPVAEDDATISVTQTDLVGHVSPAATWTLVAPSPTPEPEAAPAGTDANGTPVDDISDDVAGTASSGTVLPGYDFVDGNADATDPGNEQHAYHGTHVAGIVAASGVNRPTGVAPGVKILPIRALGDTGTLEGVADAITWAVDSTRNPYPADVLNLSLGAANTGCSNYLQSAIDTAVAKGTVVVVSAGNDATSIENQAPANCRGVIVVTATNVDRTRATYSNWGSANTPGAQVIAAPGGSGNGSDCTEPAGYACTGFVVSTHGSAIMGLTGTSMAAPHVAGTAALLKSLDKALSPAQVAYYLRGTAIPLADGCPTGTCGSGIVNAAAATAAVKALVSPNSGSGPAVSVPVNTYASTTVSVSWPKTLRLGQVITANAGNFQISYQWLRNGVPISGATGPTYLLTRADYDKKITIRVTGFAGAVAWTTSSSKATTGSLRLFAAPWISGTAAVKKKLTAHKPVWSDSVSSTKYQWYRNGKKISKATKSTYKLTKKDRGKRITVKVSVKAKYYNSTSAKSAAVVVR